MSSRGRGRGRKFEAAQCPPVSTMSQDIQDQQGATGGRPQQRESMVELSSLLPYLMQWQTDLDAKAEQESRQQEDRWQIPTSACQAPTGSTSGSCGSSFAQGQGCWWSQDPRAAKSRPAQQEGGRSYHLQMRKCLVFSTNSLKAGTHRPNCWTSEAFGETQTRSGTNMFGVFSCV